MRLDVSLPLRTLTVDDGPPSGATAKERRERSARASSFERGPSGDTSHSVSTSASAAAALVCGLLPQGGDPPAAEARSVAATLPRVSGCHTLRRRRTKRRASARRSNLPSVSAFEVMERMRAVSTRVVGGGRALVLALRPSRKAGTSDAGASAPPVPVPAPVSAHAAAAAAWAATALGSSTKRARASRSSWRWGASKGRHERRSNSSTRRSCGQRKHTGGGERRGVDLQGRTAVARDGTRGGSTRYARRLDMLRAAARHATRGGRSGRRACAAGMQRAAGMQCDRLAGACSCGEHGPPACACARACY